MARLPSKIVRFLVWSSASREQKDDVLIAMDELFGKAYEKFGPVYAHSWSVSQAVRSLPYGALGAVVKFGSMIRKLVT
jgi:hypothetical protein